MGIWLQKWHSAVFWATAFPLAKRTASWSLSAYRWSAILSSGWCGAVVFFFSEPRSHPKQYAFWSQIADHLLRKSILLILIIRHEYGHDVLYSDLVRKPVRMSCARPSLILGRTRDSCEDFNLLLLFRARFLLQRVLARIVQTRDGPVSPPGWQFVSQVER